MSRCIPDHETRLKMNKPTPRTDAARGFHDMETAVDAEEMAELERENQVLIGLLERFLREGSSLGASHPHFAACVAYPVDLWYKTREVLESYAASKNEL